VPELLLQLLDEGLADAVLLVVLLVVVALLRAGVTANRGYVDHTVSEFEEGSAHDGDVEVGDVVQDEARQILVLVLADPLDEARGRQLFPQLVGCQAVLGEAEVEELPHIDSRWVAELLLLLGKVAAADVANGNLLAQTGKEVEHLGSGILERELTILAIEP